MFSKAEMAAWILAIAIVVGMGVLVFTGPFHKINKIQAQTSAGSGGAAARVKIVNNSKTIGAYQPKTDTVKVGQTITFQNVSSVPHTVTARDRSFDSKDIVNGASWVFRPTKAGTFQYYCIYHPLMVGTLVVRS